MAVYLALVACSLFGGAVACEGSNLSAITDVLAQISEWKNLADRLNLDPGKIEEIDSECGTSAKCCRRGLVQAYCDSQVADVEDIVKNIAQALDGMGHKRQADSLRKKFHIAGSSTPSSPPHVPRKSSVPSSEDEQPTQSGDENGQQASSLPLNIATSHWEYLIAVLAVLSVVIGLLINSCCRKKEVKKDRRSPPPTPPPDSPGPKEKWPAATSGARRTAVPSPTDSMTQPIFNERVDLVSLGFLEYGGRVLRVKTELEPHWQDLAPHLGFSGPEIKTIEKSAQYQQDSSTSEMFRKWMNKDPEHTWRNLIEAMKKVGLNTLAADLVQALRQSSES